jgi:two-component system, sensor histidine kinase and response regulator
MPTLFLIEDNAPLRENTKMLLELNGFEVAGFDSGPPALEKLREIVPDLVLCDIILPGMTGYDILDRVRKMPSGSEVPFIFLSALAEKDQVRAGMNLGADDYVTKPFTSDGLLAAIKSRLERSESRRAAAEIELQRFEAQKLEYFPHEIRTPLSAIIGGIGILRLDEKKLGSDGKEILDLMEESANRLERTALNYILYLSLSAGHDPFHSTTPVEAGLLVASVATRLAQEAGRENDLVLHTVETPTHCGNCLDRIANEVVSNAFKFSPPGSKVEVNMTKAGGHLTLTCRDHGCGMTEEEIAAIGPFKQFHRDEREQQGLGLGLAICKAQIKCADCELSFKPLEPGLEVAISLPEL